MLKKLVLLLAPLLMFGAAGCNPAAKQATQSVLEKNQSELLQTAFEVASLIPIQPHIESRSRAQKKVFDACLELKQESLAAEFAGQIKDWRRGLAHADLAFYFASSGNVQAAREQVTVAEQILAAVQDWPRDRIKARLAQVEVLLGRSEEEERQLSGVDETEAAKVAVTRADISDETQYDQQIEALRKLLGSAHFDLRKQGLFVGIELYKNFYHQVEWRNEIETEIRAAMATFYPVFRVELLLALSEAATAHNDPAQGRALLNEAIVQMDDVPFQAQYGIPLLARVAQAAYLAGDVDLAQDMMLAGEEMYETRQLEIVDIYRAGALLPLAGVYQLLGNATAALSVYGRAIDASVINPNSRPRAEDLTLICLSMAVQGVEPDAELKGRVHEIKLSLGDPW
jgi:hypothetical protein